MSVKVMNAVFERYPNGGGEMLLALALADHAHDDGTHIYPSIKALADKTRQSERSVQYQLRKMEESGWLILQNSGNGGRNQHREYSIDAAWLKGANDDKKGATGDVKGANDDSKGCNPLHPHITINNHQEPSENHQRSASALPAVAEGSDDPVMYHFPLNDKSVYGLRQSQVRQLAELYPSVAIDAELRACVGWNMANDRKRKTRRGIFGHINTWLAGKQDRGGGQYQSPLKPPYQTANDKAKAWADKVTGNTHANHPEFIDIN